MFCSIFHLDIEDSTKEFFEDNHAFEPDIFIECEVLDVLEVTEEETVIVVPDFDPHISVYIPFMEQVRLSHSLLIIPGFLWVGIQSEHFKTKYLI